MLELGLHVGVPGVKATADLKRHPCCFEGFPEELGTLAAEPCASLGGLMSLKFLCIHD